MDTTENTTLEAGDYETTRWIEYAGADTIKLYITPAYTWYNIGNKGSVFSQGVGYGDVRVLAGGVWTTGVYSGSRCRYLHYSGWLLSIAGGARGLSDNVVK
jgi:hypothetical protein